VSWGKLLLVSWGQDDISPAFPRAGKKFIPRCPVKVMAGP
jgi:hypothetical protein